jgi:hypothetical protein
MNRSYILPLIALGLAVLALVGALGNQHRLARMQDDAMLRQVARSHSQPCARCGRLIYDVNPNEEWGVINPVSGRSERWCAECGRAREDSLATARVIKP